MQNIDVLYCSTVCSKTKLKQISDRTGYPLTSITIQKFHQLILNGLVMNKAIVHTVSTPYVSNRIFNRESDDNESGVIFHYLSTIEIPLIRHICIILGTLYSAFKWKLKSKNDKFIVCDVLNISVSIGVLLSRVFGVKIVGIMTDMPGLMVRSPHGFFGLLVKKINLFILRRFDAYIFLTDAMNQVINTRKRPYMIMEGLVDINMKALSHVSDLAVRNVIYAGGVHERYGLRTLIEAFRQISGTNLKLSIYGKLGGAITMDEMREYEKLDPRFHYFGVKSNDEIVQEELKATLLVNPRPTSEEFTKFSFPSKNMEYMVSGSAVLTTPLPGMPKEYYDKLFVCYDETVEGFACELKRILNLSDHELIEKGKKGREFVLNLKNNKVQGKRIIEFLNKIQ